jgi:hypothetical protein
MKLILFFLLLTSSSCYLVTGFKTRSFSYANDKQQKKTFKLQVPRGYLSEKITHDNTGGKEQLYQYSNGTVFYVAYTRDTLKTFQPIKEEDHIPLPHPQGGWIYKGVGKDGLYWREIRQDSLRFGYRFVPSILEAKFDEALNFNSLQKGKR